MEKRRTFDDLIDGFETVTPPKAILQNKLKISFTYFVCSLFGFMIVIFGILAFIISYRHF